MGVALSLTALGLLLLISLATNYNYFHDDVNRSAAAILRVAAINAVTLALGLASIRGALRYRRADAPLTQLGILGALTAAGLLLTAVFQLAFDHH